MTTDTERAAASTAEPSHAVLLERARVIAANARGRADQTNAERCVPRETIGELADADLLRVVQPRRWGGLERSWHELYELAYTVGHGCGSTGWVYVVLAGHMREVSEKYPIEAQEDVWGSDQNALVSSAFSPTGILAPTEGGYTLTGRFPFSSGVDHATWSLVGALAPHPDFGMFPHLCLVQVSEMTIVDDWHTVGLCGTGSKTMVTEGMFVPSHRVGPFMPPLGTTAPFSLQCALVGVARGALESFVEQTKVKPGFLGGPPPATSEMFQAAIGQSHGDLTAAWTLLNKAVADTERLAPHGTPVPPDMSLENQTLNGVISRLTVAAIERIFALSGGHGIHDGPVSRALRDVLAGAQHLATNGNVTAVRVGAALLAGAPALVQPSS